jgi:hypothetical protein
MSKKIGRPIITENRKFKKIVYIDQETNDFFASQGNGSISRGLRSVAKNLSQIQKNTFLTAKKTA